MKYIRRNNGDAAVTSSSAEIGLRGILPLSKDYLGLVNVGRKPNGNSFNGEGIFMSENWKE
jgi:hypothetical protein